MINTAIIDYGMGNLASVANALKYLGHQVDIVESSSLLSNYENIILPGVGAFGKAMESLRRSGMDKAIVEESNKGKRIIGICLGMQLLFSKSREFGDYDGLNLIEGEVIPFEEKIELIVPHMGWNNVKSTKPDFVNLEGDYYFVHSFYCKPKNSDDILFVSDYGIEFCSAVSRSNQIFGFQFHPEKSQKNGLNLLERFLLDG